MIIYDSLTMRTKEFLTLVQTAFQKAIIATVPAKDNKNDINLTYQLTI